MMNNQNNQSKFQKWIDEYDNKKYIVERDNYIEAKGGDGTLIRAIHMHKDKNKPFFGIAKGSINFLMNKESQITEKVTSQKFYLITGKVTYTRKTFGWKDEEVTEEFIAFNEIAIGNFNAWIEFNCEHEDNILGKFKGSGLIVSTTQGSTGSNKNNHGTILPLSSKNWSVTGIMTNRRINYVLESNKLQIYCESRQNIKLHIDGEHKIFEQVKYVEINRGESVNILFNDIQIFREKRMC